MANTIKLEDLEKEIYKLTSEYGEKVKKEAEKGLKEAAYHASGTLKKGGAYKERTGKYTPNWYVSQESPRDPDNPTYIVHNKRMPGLAHLLEHGHVNRQGKRVKPIIHIEPVEGMAQEWALENVEKAIDKVNRSI